MAFGKKPFKKDDGLTAEERSEQEIRRIKLPRGREVLGLLERRLGGSRLEIRCLDGKRRNCRIPGRLKRSLWCREGDVVIVEPWEFSGDERGDVVFKYTKTQVNWLRQNGYLKKLEETDEF
jgi:translation initiation factor 1A